MRSIAVAIEVSIERPATVKFKGLLNGVRLLTERENLNRDLARDATCRGDLGN